MNGRLTSIEICRQAAQEVWRVERAAEPFFVHGLSSERSVRERLQRTAMELLASTALTESFERELRAINFSTDDPLSVLERTEALLAHFLPGHWSSPEDLFQSTGARMQLALRLLIVQCVAGRLGKWAVRPQEIPDARIARSLHKGLGVSKWAQYRALLDASEELLSAGRHREAATSLLDADRLVRTASGLLKAATALTTAGDYISALWTVRTCLLEQRSTFESNQSLEKALRLEQRLCAVIEGRAEIPLTTSEAEILLDQPKKPRPTAELIQRTAPRKLPTPVVSPPPLRSSKAFSAAPTKVDVPRIQAVSPPPLIKTERLLIQPRPIAHALSELDAVLPSRNAVDFVRANPPEAITAKNEIKAVRSLVSRRPTLPPSSAHRRVLLAERGDGSRTWEEAPITQNLELEDAIEIEIDLHSELHPELHPELHLELQPELENLPTDTSMPVPPVLTMPSVHEITERIRARAP
jgi:hypothetical protein